ncbi:AsmA-like C-terminal region-containing protein [Agrobacterium sp.]|uniref:AsmA family protein n=1 Tax=Agrobacterium sp. TaxID=361 RepID=UPI0028AC53AE|nr:AsmA-like C-terminal region-containing protein [Agrobacterium sp.]
MLGRILVFLGGLLVVALFAALLVPYFIDWTSFRRDFEDQASRILGKKVVVYGAVEARLLPFPSVTLHDVRAGMDADGSPLIQVARFSMDAELAPFMSGEARIFDMRIEEPKAKIRLLKDGTLDWMRGSRADIPAKTVVLEKVSIEGGQIEFIDEQSGRNRTVTDLTADMSARSLAGPWRVEGRGAIDGHAGRFSLSSGEPDSKLARIGLRLRLLPDEHPVAVDLDGGLAVTDGKPVYSGNFNFQIRQDDKGKKPQQQASIFSAPRTQGKFELTNESVRVPEYRMELGDAGNPYVITGEATLDTGTQPEFLLTADGQQIDVNNFAVPVQSGKTARVPVVSVRQRIEDFAALIARIPVPQVPGKATIRLPALVADDTTIRDIQLDVRPAGAGWQIVNAVAIMPGRTQLEASGSLTLSGGPAFNGDLLVASNQPSGLANWLSGTVDPAIRQLDSAGFSASVSLTTQLQRFENLELVIGNASLKGRLERQSSNDQPPSLSIDLAGNEIDLGALKAIGGLVMGEQGDSSISQHRMAARFKADRFNVSGVTANQVETAFSIDNGVLNVEKLTAGDVAGAQLEASARLEGSLLNYAGKGSVSLRAEDPQPFLTMLQQHLPGHPILQKMVDSASWYVNSDLKADLSIGSENEGMSVALSGTVNGSRISAVAKVPDILSITDDTAFSLESVLKNQSTSILFGQVGFDPLPFDADGEGLVSLKINGTLGNAANTDIRFSTEKTHATLVGSFNLSGEKFWQGAGDFSLESADIEPYLIMNGVSLPQIGGGMAMKMKSRVEVAPDVVKVSDINGQSAGNPISGNLTVQRAAPHKVEGDLSLGTVDLAWLGDTTYGPVFDSTHGGLNAEQVSLPSFPGLEASVTLKAGNLQTGILESVSGFSTRLTQSNGRLSLEEMNGDWMGGKVSGTLTMATGEKAGIFRSNITVTGVDPQAHIWQLAGAPVATGRFDVNFNAEATGASVHDMLVSAGGSGEIRANGLTVRGINLAAFAPLLAEADKIEGEIDAAKTKPLVDALIYNGEVKADSLAMPFILNNGALRLQGISLSTEQASLAGEVNLDLLEQTVDGNLNVTFNPGQDAQAGGDPAVRLLYSGPLATPSVSTDVSAVSGYLSLRAFEKERRRVETLQANILEKQRLRREAALYTARAAERQAAKEKAEAEEKARLEEEARVKAEEDKARQLQLQFDSLQAVPQTQEVIRQPLAPPYGTATP